MGMPCRHHPLPTIGLFRPSWSFLRGTAAWTVAAVVYWIQASTLSERGLIAWLVAPRCHDAGRLLSHIPRCAGSKLPAGQHRPKQSLGQSYLTDPNYIAKITSRFEALVPSEARGKRVVEFASGLGAITRPLIQRFPDMTAVEIDGRAVDVLNREMPTLNLLHADILELGLGDLAKLSGGALRIVGNLPYSVATDILFKLAREAAAIDVAFVMVQKEVAQKIVAAPGTKEYCPLAIMLQLHAAPKMAFSVPPAAFYPKPKVTSAMVELQFDNDASRCGGFASIDFDCLREVLTVSFQQRNKFLRHSLKPLLDRQRCGLPGEFEKRRAEQLTPTEFVELTRMLFPRASRVGV